MLCGELLLTMVLADWFTVHRNAEVEIVGLDNIVTTVRLLPFLTKTQVYFLQDHGHRLPLIPTPP
jgi:hypothetical protein